MIDELNPAPLANGHAEGLGPVPVMGTEPVVAKPKRKRKKKAAPKVKKQKPDLHAQLRAEQEASKASATDSPVATDATPIEEAPTSTLLTDVGADHFREARERVLEKQFRDGVQSLLAPPIKSTWAQRFVFGLRRMTGLDGDDTPARPSTQFAVLLCLLTGAAAIGVALPWL